MSGKAPLASWRTVLPYCPRGDILHNYSSILKPRNELGTTHRPCFSLASFTHTHARLCVGDLCRGAPEATSPPVTTPKSQPSPPTLMKRNPKTPRQAKGPAPPARRADGRRVIFCPKHPTEQKAPEVLAKWKINFSNHLES